MKQLLKDGHYYCGNGQGWVHIWDNGNNVLWATHRDVNDRHKAPAISICYHNDKLFLACEQAITMWPVDDSRAKEIELIIKGKIRLAYALEKRKVGKTMPAILLKKNDIFYLHGEKWRACFVGDNKVIAHKLSWLKKDAIQLSNGHDVIFAGHMSKLRAFFVL